MKRTTYFYIDDNYKEENDKQKKKNKAISDVLNESLVAVNLCKKMKERNITTKSLDKFC